MLNESANLQFLYEDHLLFLKLGGQSLSTLDAMSGTPFCILATPKQILLDQKPHRRHKINGFIPYNDVNPSESFERLESLCHLYHHHHFLKIVLIAITFSIINWLLVAGVYY